MTDPTPTPTPPAAEPPAPEPTPPATDPEGLGEAGTKALKTERAAREKAERALKALQDAEALREQAALSDLERAQKAAKDATDQAQSATLSALRYRVALAKGLPANLAERLQGTTQEELEADADELAGMVTTTPNGAVRPDPSQGPRSSQQSAGPASDFAAAVSKALSR